VEAGIYRPQIDETSRWISVLASVLMHGLLALVLFYGINWQSHAPEEISAELVQSLSPQPAMPAPELTRPKPAPKIEPKPEPKAEPKPEPVKPDIAIKVPEHKKPEKKEPPKPEPKPEKKEPPKPEPKPEKKEPPKPELKPEVKEKPSKAIVPEDAVNKLLQKEADRISQAKMDAKLNQEQKKVVAAREDSTRKAADQANSQALNNALGEWKNRIRSKVRSKISLPPGVSGDPRATFELELLPDGSIAHEPRLTKSSGIPALDEAIKRAILKSDPFPLPTKSEVFERSLKLEFDPLHD